MFSSQIKASPVGIFTASPAQGCSPLVVSFTNQSTGSVSYDWDFGNSNKSTLANPSAIYYIPGYYTVKLTAYDGLGGKHELIKSIRVFKDPLASLTVSKKEICSGEELIFSSTSGMGDTGLAILSWDFGDGTLRTGEIIRHTYTQSGQFNVALHILDLNGCSSDTVMTRLINVKERPEADFEVDYNSFCSAPATVNFTNKSTGAKPNKYAWEFGDGANSTADNPSNVYKSFGIFNPRLIVTGSTGCKDTGFLKNPVSIVKLKSDFSIPTDLCGPDDFTFIDKTVPSLPSMSYQWLLDGKTVGTSFSLTLQLDPGSYSLKFNIYDKKCYDEIERSFTINAKPAGILSLSPKYLCQIPQNIDLTFSPANYNTYDWQINGKSVGSGPAINYTEQKVANSLVSVVVNNKGCEAEFSDTLIYSVPKVSIKPGDTSGCLGMIVPFRTTVYSKFPIVSYDWLFGDGGSSNLINPSYQFNDTGIFLPRLMVKNDKGCINSTRDTIMVGVKIPPEFSYDTTAICNGEYKYFQNLTNESPVKPQRYEWILGDSTDEGKNPNHRFHQTPGKKAMKLITHYFGCTDTFVYPDSLNIKAPFSWPIVKFDNCGPTEVEFFNNSQGATSFLWMFSPVDGRTEDKIKMTLYPGNYKVGIASYNSSTGCRDTNYNDFSIFSKPLVSYSSSANLDCPPVTLNVNLNVNNADNNLLVEAGDQSDFKEFIWRLGYDTSWYKYYYTFSNLPSVFDLKITATNHYGCSTSVLEKFNGSGPKADGNVKSEGTCFPFKLTLTDNTYGSDGFEHYWLVGANGPIPITSKVMYLNLEEKYQGKNDVPVRLKVGNDSCWDIVTFIVRVNGFDATIGVVSSIICNQIAFGVKAAMMPDTFTNLVYQWGVNSNWGQEQFTDSRTYVLPLDMKVDTLRVRIKHPDGCITAQSELLYKPKATVEALFTADTTGSPCPPLFVNFKDKSSAASGPISSWLWDLGDGSTSVKQNPDKMYLVPGSYSVSLTVTDRKGCKNTSLIPDFVIIEGPKAAKLVSPLSGCIPLQVNYTASSPELVAFKWDLGDGIVTFENDLVHEYNQAGTYIPLLTVSDSFGCSYTMPRTDTIRTYSNSSPTFLVSGVCVSDTIAFSQKTNAQSGRISAYYWDFGDGEKDTGSNILHVYKQGGTYKISLKVTSENGCMDSVSNPLKFYGGIPFFTYESKGICYKDSILISNLSKADTNILGYTWKFGDTYITQNKPSFHFKPGKPGVYPVTLIMNTQGGCSFVLTDSMGIAAADTFPLAQAIIKRISVLDDISAELKIVSNPEPFLAGHSVWLQNAAGGFNRQANFGKNDSLFEIKNLNTLEKSYCMLVVRENFCKTQTPPDTTFKHCTVELKAVGDTMRNLLNWSPYIGWNLVDRYEVFARLEDRPDFEYLGQVLAPQTNYFDTAFACFARKRYQIKAIEYLGFGESSWSDTASASPLLGYKMVAPEVWRASVENDDRVLLEWVTPYPNVMPLEIIEVYRSEDNGLLRLWGTVDATVFQQNDMKVKVDKSSYLYKVRAMDTCKVWTPFSNHGKTIVLKVGYNHETFQPELAWSSYGFWNEGVDYYLVERQQPDGRFMTIARTMTRYDTTYNDEVAIEQCDPFYCYRVTAVRGQPASYPDSTHDVISHSNVNCAGVQSTVFAPNAFTLNRDGLNETFKPRGMFLKKYELNIYNRWGERLFTTTECLKGWDGRYLDKQCQSGTYLYIINAVGADDVVHTLKGTVHLLD